MVATGALRCARSCGMSLNTFMATVSIDPRDPRGAGSKGVPRERHAEDPESQVRIGACGQVVRHDADSARERLEAPRRGRLENVHHAEGHEGTAQGERSHGDAEKRHEEAGDLVDYHR